MGYETPSIDRIAREGIKLQHYYGEQSLHRGARGIPSPVSTAFVPGSPRWDFPARRWV